MFLSSGHVIKIKKKKGKKGKTEKKTTTKQNKKGRRHWNPAKISENVFPTISNSTPEFSSDPGNI